MNFFDIVFWQSFVSNLGATVIGVALGILGALLIDRWIESRKQKERVNKILSVINDELKHDWAVIYSWLEKPQRPVEIYNLFSQLRNESWKALKDGGDLEPIKDPGLIGSLAEAYSLINALTLMSEKFFDLEYLSITRIGRMSLDNMWKKIIEKAKETENYLRDITIKFEYTLKELPPKENEETNG